MKISKNLFALSALALAAAFPSTAAARDPIVVLNEGFRQVDMLAGWSMSNLSVPPGQSWFQGNPGIFRARSGPASSYIAANQLSALNGDGFIDNWLITPAVQLIGPSTLSFFTRGAVTPGFNDTLDVLFSTGGTDPGNFTLLRTVGGITDFPNAWRQFTNQIDYEGAAHFAFRYRGDAEASNYVGIDSVRITTVPEPSAYLMLLAGLGALAWLRRRLAP